MPNLIVILLLLKGQNTYVIDLDIQKAYDSCDRNDARDNIRRYGVREGIISLWELLNTNSTTDLYFNNKIIGTFK